MEDGLLTMEEIMRLYGMEEDGKGIRNSEGFRDYIDHLSSQLNQMEQKVKLVEQFFKNSNTNNKETNPKYYKNAHHHKANNTNSNKPPMQQELISQFSLMFHQITQHKWAVDFMQPVDVEGLQLHDYYQVIEKPMDLSTIKTRMEAKDDSAYANVREIYADVRLVFKNAMKYNDERNEFHVKARTLLEKFEEKWLQLLPKVVEAEKGQEEERAAKKMDVKLVEEVSHAKMAYELSAELSEIDLHLEGLRELVVRKCRKMSTEDRKRLFTALTQLSAEDLRKALEIVAQANPSFKAETEEVELDLSAQNEVTLWRLKVFVQDMLKVKSNKPGAVDDNGNKSNELNANNINAKRRRDNSDAQARTPTKKPRKISINSLNGR